MMTIKADKFIPCPAGQHWYVEVEQKKVEVEESKHLRGIHSFYVQIVGWASYGEGFTEMSPVICGDYGRLVFVDDAFGKESILEVSSKEVISDGDLWQWDLCRGAVVWYESQKS